MQPYVAEQAETVALTALGWLVSQEELLPVFLGSTGASSEDLRASATEPQTLASVLDFLMMDDAWVTSFARDTGLPPEAAMRARAGLPGAEQVHWT